MPQWRLALPPPPEGVASTPEGDAFYGGSLRVGIQKQPRGAQPTADRRRSALLLFQPARARYIPGHLHGLHGRNCTATVSQL